MDIPQFLKGIKVTKKDENRLWPLMSNWVVLAQNITLIDDEEDLKKMILIEINRKYRLDIIQRLKSRLNTVRKKRENLELTSFRTP